MSPRTSRPPNNKAIITALESQKAFKYNISFHCFPVYTHLSWSLASPLIYGFDCRWGHNSQFQYQPLALKYTKRNMHLNDKIICPAHGMNIILSCTTSAATSRNATTTRPCYRFQIKITGINRILAITTPALYTLQSFHFWYIFQFNTMPQTNEINFNLIWSFTK